MVISCSMSCLKYTTIIDLQRVVKTEVCPRYVQNVWSQRVWHPSKSTSSKDRMINYSISSNTGDNNTRHCMAFCPCFFSQRSLQISQDTCTYTLTDPILISHAIYHILFMSSKMHSNDTPCVTNSVTCPVTSMYSTATSMAFK